MTRIIKFRAWDKISKTFLVYWSQGQMVENKTETVVIMQFTGLTDKNGKEIYEGDVVRLTSKTHEPEVGVVEWNKLEFHIRFDEARTSHGLWTHWVEREVIGNIYENPELIQTNK